MTRYVIQTQKTFEQTDGWKGSVQAASYTVEASCIREALSEAVNRHECETIDTDSCKVLQGMPPCPGLWASITAYGPQDPEYVNRPAFHIVAAKEQN